MRNRNSVDKVVLVSLLLTWNTLTDDSVPTRDNDQLNALGKDIDLLTSLTL